MDHGERIAKVEAVVDEHRQQMDRFEHEFARIHASIDALREHCDRGLAELREHTDRGLAELRAHTDQGLAELRAHTDKGFAELRQEMQKTTGWLVGLAIGYGATILGMLGRIGGLY